MGSDAADRQVTASGSCICRRRTIRIANGAYRTIHSKFCVKYRDWMAEYQPSEATAASASAHIAAAHNAPKHNDDT